MMAEMVAERLGYRAALDGLRGVAVLLVLGLHWFPTWLPGGRIGVDLFFVLSGFLITTLMLEGRPTFLRFYERRARRLLPALAVLLGIFWWAEGAGWVALYVGNWARAAGSLSPYLEHCWSLAIEEQFYLVWPLAFWVLRRISRPRAAAVMMSVAFGSAAWRIGLDAPWQRLSNGTDTRLDGLAIGCAVAFAWPWLSRVRWRPFAPICLAGCLGVAVLNADLLGWGYTLVSLSWGVVLLAVLGGWGRAVFTWRGLTFAGVLSYSLYLWHYPITIALRGGDLHSTGTVSTAAAIAASVAAAWLSWRFVERPFRSRHRTHEDAAAHPGSSTRRAAVLHGEGR